MSGLEEIDGRADAYLALEYEASSAYNLFVYDDRDHAETLRRRLFESGAAEFAPRFGRLWVEEGKVAGMIACAPGGDVAKCRMKSAMLLSREGLLDPTSGFYRRLVLAGRTLLPQRPGDFYLSRIAVAPANAGEGLGARLLGECERQAGAAEAGRIVLEVAEDNPAAGFYERHGFARIGGESVKDEESGRTLAYLHFARAVEG
jgi:ribosomal protein S18 acetylase RimI-like enzyme